MLNFSAHQSDPVLAGRQINLPVSMPTPLTDTPPPILVRLADLSLIMSGLSRGRGLGEGQTAFWERLSGQCLGEVSHWGVLLPRATGHVTLTTCDRTWLPLWQAGAFSGMLTGPH